MRNVTRWITAALLGLTLTACSDLELDFGGGDGDTNAPGSVTALAAGGHVEVAWSDRSDDEAGFVVFRSEASGNALAPAQGSEVGRTGPNVTSFLDFSAHPQTEYRYGVAALTDEGPGEPTQAPGTIGPNAVELTVDLAGFQGDSVEGILTRYMAGRPAVTVVPADESIANDRYNAYKQLFAAGSDAIDVVPMDVVWVGEFASHLLDFGDIVAAEVAAEHAPATVQNGTADGRLVALPWLADVGLLYFRSDLLATYGFDGPPTTWTELEAMAREIQEGERVTNGTFWGFVWQGQAYEGLTCNALEWLASSGAGTIVSPDGVVTLDNPAAVAAVERAAAWVDDISPPEVTGWAEENVRTAFQAGDAAFMRNWPYAYTLVNDSDSPVAGNVGVAQLPATDGVAPAGALGGWHLSVNSATQHGAAAADFALFATSAAEQKRRALEQASYWPTRLALYADEGILAAHPQAEQIGAALANAVARPATVMGADYAMGTVDFFSSVHDVLTGTATAADALASAATAIADRTGFPKGSP